MTMKLTPRIIVDIITAYKVDLVPITHLAKQHHVTRQAVYKALKSHGIDTTKQANGKLTVSCTCCGKPIAKSRSIIRNRKHIFCDKECYYAYIEGLQQGEYNQSRQGQRVARAIVSRCFELKPGHIIHHEDRNNKNNHPSNLKVFANQGDHIRYHRWDKDGIEIQPLWDGSIIWVITHPSQAAS